MDPDLSSAVGWCSLVACNQANYSVLWGLDGLIKRAIYPRLCLPVGTRSK